MGRYWNPPTPYHSQTRRGPRHGGSDHMKCPAAQGVSGCNPPTHALGLGFLGGGRAGGSQASMRLEKPIESGPFHQPWVFVHILSSDCFTGPLGRGGETQAGPSVDTCPLLCQDPQLGATWGQDGVGCRGLGGLGGPSFGGPSLGPDPEATTQGFFPDLRLWSPPGGSDTGRGATGRGSGPAEQAGLPGAALDPCAWQAWESRGHSNKVCPGVWTLITLPPETSRWRGAGEGHPISSEPGPCRTSPALPSPPLAALAAQASCNSCWAGFTHHLIGHTRPGEPRGFA